MKASDVASPAGNEAVLGSQGSSGSAFTKGPWLVRGPHKTQIHAEAKPFIASAHYQHTGIPAAQANARLISAAPDLYAALRHVTDLLHDVCKDERDDPSVGITGWTDCHRAVAEARAALSKATA